MKRKIISFTLVVLIVLSLFPVSAFAADMATWAGAANVNAANNNLVSVPIVTSADTAYEKWNVKVSGGTGAWGLHAGQPVIVDGYLYITGNGLQKIDITNGAIIESVSGGTSSMYYDYLCYGDGLLFVATENSITAYSLSLIHI